MMTPFFGLSMIIHLVIITIGKFFYVFRKHAEPKALLAVMSNNSLWRRAISFLLIVIIATTVLLFAMRTLYSFDSNNYESMKYIKLIFDRNQRDILNDILPFAADSQEFIFRTEAKLARLNAMC